MSRGGENISCAEVEGAFHAACGEHVMECAAFGLKHPRLGEEVGLMVFRKPGSAASAVDLVEAITSRKMLAAFKTPLPANIDFTDLPLPRGATGKILKREIRQIGNAKREAPQARL